MQIKKGDHYKKEFTVSEQVYASFMETFKDRNPIHMSDEFAQSKGFQGKVMHGNILNGFLSYFIGECLPEKNVIIHSQDIQFKKPVYLQDVLRLEVVVDGIYESVNAIEFKFQFKNNKDIIVANGKIQIGVLA